MPASIPFGQTFQTGDIGVVAFLVLLEGLLSADNALVLAIMVKHLPKEQRQKALLYGLGGAFAFRLVAIVLAAQIIALWWLQLIGALYLLWLPIKHFHRSAQPHGSLVKPGAGLWGTVLAVELTDISFAIDSVLAGVSTIGSRQDKIWVVYLGAIIGIVLLRFAAGFFVRLLERFPAIDHVAYLLVGWVGVKLLLMAGHHYEHESPLGLLPFAIPEMAPVVFWGVLLAIAAVGTVVAVRHPSKTHTLDEMAEEIDEAEDLVQTPEERADDPETIADTNEVA